MLCLLQYVRYVKLQPSCVRPTVMYIYLAMLHRINVILKVNICNEQRLPWPGSSNMKVDRMLKLPLLYASASPRHTSPSVGFLQCSQEGSWWWYCGHCTNHMTSSVIELTMVNMDSVEKFGSCNVSTVISYEPVSYTHLDVYKRQVIW